MGGTPAGTVDSTSVIGGVDFLPTIASLAGVNLPGGKDLDGEDMSGAIRGTPTAKEKPLMWENRFPVYGHVLHKSPVLAIRDGDWKLLMNPDRSRTELYNIPADPSELNNVAEKHAGIVDRLASRLLAWQAALPEGPIHPDAGSNAYPWPGSE